MDLNRRQALTLLGGIALNSAARAEPETPLPTFWKSRLADVDDAVKKVKKGSASLLAKSGGKRDIHLISYGEKQAAVSHANYNSACGGNFPAAYCSKDGKQRPSIFLLGPVHGAEFEGIVGLVNLLEVAETGKDLRGQVWPKLVENFAKCRVLIVPCGNPDGRARCKLDSWVGEELNVNESAGMGVQLNGENFRWPGVKRVHPMKPGAVRLLGAYFNDDGVNLMHDEWFDPMAGETKAFFKLAREEAPDYIVSLHSHASDPSVEPTAYAPRTVKETIKKIADRLYKRYIEAGLGKRAAGPEPRDDGATFPPPSFNLCSALHHVCGGVAFVHETCVGVKTPPYPKLTHAQILDMQMLLYDTLFHYAVENPVKWTK